MKKPDTPKNEATRIQTLNSLDILDTSSDERFDRLTRMAKRLFDVPIALVSLVDADRQWFKSCIGLDVSETSRDISFCGHAILGTEVFVINNALEDERFFDNPLVTDKPHIRFYAGCPLNVADGERIGTLCIIDTKPRDFSEEEKYTLIDLAKMVVDELSALKMATIDALTGISNRYGFLTLADPVFRFCDAKDIPITLIFIDLDRFKEINDTYGHQVGDNALVQFASMMKDSFRISDLIARFGGDEFIAFLVGADKTRAEVAHRYFDSNVKECNRIECTPFQLQYSYGLVQVDFKRHKDIQAVLDEGDKLMYEQKKSR